MRYYDTVGLCVSRPWPPRCASSPLAVARRRFRRRPWTAVRAPRARAAARVLRRVRAARAGRAHQAAVWEAAARGQAFARPRVARRAHAATLPAPIFKTILETAAAAAGPVNRAHFAPEASALARRAKRRVRAGRAAAAPSAVARGNSAAIRRVRLKLVRAAAFRTIVARARWAARRCASALLRTHRSQPQLVIVRSLRFAPATWSTALTEGR